MARTRPCTSPPGTRTLTTSSWVLDVERKGVVHARLDCAAHLGLIELVEDIYGCSAEDPADVEAVAHRHGLLVEHNTGVRDLHFCPQCCDSEARTSPIAA